MVNSEGTVRLELRTPFSYLKGISNEIRENQSGNGSRQGNKKADVFIGSRDCSNSVSVCVQEETLLEQALCLTPAEFLTQIAFPQREHLTRLSQRNHKTDFNVTVEVTASPTARGSTVAEVTTGTSKSHYITKE